LHCILLFQKLTELKQLRKVLDQHPEIEVVGETESYKHALEILKSRTPYLIFADSSLAKRFVTKLPTVQSEQLKPAVVWVSTNSQDGIEAFDCNAIDDLVPPFHLDRIGRTINKTKLHFMGQFEPADQPENKITTFSDSLMLRTDINQVTSLKISDIILIKADGDYTRVLTKNSDNILLRHSLNRWTDILLADNFLRLDRSTILNTSYIKSIARKDRNTTRISLQHLGTPFIEVGRLANIRLRRYLKE